MHGLVDAQLRNEINKFACNISVPHFRRAALLVFGHILFHSSQQCQLPVRVPMQTHIHLYIIHTYVSIYVYVAVGMRLRVANKIAKKGNVGLKTNFSFNSTSYPDLGAYIRYKCMLLPFAFADILLANSMSVPPLVHRVALKHTKTCCCVHGNVQFGYCSNISSSCRCD